MSESSQRFTLLSMNQFLLLNALAACPGAVTERDLLQGSLAAMSQVEVVHASLRAALRKLRSCGYVERVIEERSATDLAPRLYLHRPTLRGREALRAHRNALLSKLDIASVPDERIA